MSKLSNTIEAYYWANFDQLSYEKQFHFISRLHLWNQTPETALKIQALRSQFTANEQPHEALQKVIAATQASPIHGSKNAAELRRPYFEAFPKLKTYVSALFRITFLYHVYGLDVRSDFLEQFDEAEVNDYAERLLQEPQALAILSTHAINFLYLYYFVIRQETSVPGIEEALSKAIVCYDFSNRLHLQLYIYLYTHCIIGASQFYRFPITDHAPYIAMLKDLERVIDEYFVDINLDNKFEFLTCARLLKTSSYLESRISGEAQQSISEHGDFLIDCHNNNPQSSNVTLDSSEHRNVLFILANQPFTPLQ